MSDKFYDPNNDVITTSHNDKVKLKQLEDEVLRLHKEAKEKDRVIKHYEEAISQSSIKDITTNDFTNEDINNIMGNQTFIVVKNKQ